MGIKLNSTFKTAKLLLATVNYKPQSFSNPDKDLQIFILTLFVCLFGLSIV